jgi:hypothetical protein
MLLLFRSRYARLCGSSKDLKRWPHLSYDFNELSLEFSVNCWETLNLSSFSLRLSSAYTSAFRTEMTYS